MNKCFALFFLIAAPLTAFAIDPFVGLDLGVNIGSGLTRYDLGGLVETFGDDGSNSSNHSTRYSTQGDLWLQDGPVIFSLRALYGTEAITFRYPERWDVELAPMAGLTTPRSWWQLSASAGLGFITGIQQGKYLGKQKNTPDPLFATIHVVSLSVPLEVKAVVFPFDHVGVGLKLSSSINAVYTNTGIVMFVSFR